MNHASNVVGTPEQRKEALKISASLYAASKMISKKEFDVQTIKEEMLRILEPLEIGYVEIVNREFKPINDVEVGNTIILVEAVAGTTRLLDNIWL